MMSPDAMRSTGAPAASYQPYATVDGVASRRWVLGGAAKAPAIAAEMSSPCLVCTGDSSDACYTPSALES